MRYVTSPDQNWFFVAPLLLLLFVLMLMIRGSMIHHSQSVIRFVLFHNIYNTDLAIRLLVIKIRVTITLCGGPDLDLILHNKQDSNLDNFQIL